jgi:hypothetical protein
METGLGLFLGVVLLFVVAFLPGVIITVVGWKTTRRIENDYLRVVIRSGVLAVSFTPTAYGHAGVMPALWMLVVGSGTDRFTYSLYPIACVWIVGGGVALVNRWRKGKRFTHELDAE